MSANENSLLLRIRGDSSGGRAAVSETRQAIAGLRTSATSDLKAIQTASTSSLGGITQAAGQLSVSLPFVGQTVSNLSTQFSSLTTATQSSKASIAGVAGVVIVAVAALGSLASAGTGAVQGLVSLTRETAEFQGKLFDLSQQTGVSVETLSALEVVAKTTGSSIESLVASLGIFQKNLEESLDTNSKAAKAFERLGVEVTNTEDTFRATLLSLAKMPEGFRQTALALELFGRGGKSVLAVLKETNGDIDSTIEKLRGLGLVTTEQARKADQFNDQIVLLQVALRGLGTEAIPPVTDALVTLQKTIDENKGAVDFLKTAIGFLAGSFALQLETVVKSGEAVWKSHRVEVDLVTEAYQILKLAIRDAVGEIPKQPIPLTTGAEDGLKLLKEISRFGVPLTEKQDFSKIKGLFLPDPKDALNAQREALNVQLEVLQGSIGDRQQLFQAETEDLQRELEKRQILFNDYIRTATKANDDRLASVLANLEKERDAVKSALDQGVINANEAASKRRVIDDLERDVRREATREQQRLDDEIEANKRKQFEVTTEVLRTTLEAQLTIAEIIDNRRIAAIRTLAETRVTTEEEAERRILAIRLAAIDREKDVLDSQVKAAESITDPEEQLKVRARLNLRLRVLAEERISIEQSGEVGVEAGRQRDLENARRYAGDLNDVQQRIVDVQRDAAEEALRLMSLHFASRRDLIRARLQLDIEDEDARHRNAQQGIDALRQENAEAKRVREEKLQAEREINTLEEAEAERHRLTLEAIRRKGRLDEKEASPLGRLDLDIDNLKEFAATIEESIVPLGEILQRTFLQVADAIGQTVANWVLLGETGPAVMRKILAQALASIAAEAAVNTIKELALGFAMLFINPAESGAHFTAAALWASIGGVAAIVGRNVAGDLFKPKSSSGGRDSGPPRPLDTVVERGRNQQVPVAVNVNITHAEGMIVKTVVDDFNNGGITRETIQRDGR